VSKQWFCVRVLVAFSMVAALTACGGGSGSGGTADAADTTTAGDTTAPPPPDTTVPPRGGTYWEGCPSDVFLDVSKAPGPGSNYPAPFLNVSCDDDYIIVETNGLPHYTFVPMTPNPLVAADHTYQIPLNPKVADVTSHIPFLGYVGVVINGTSVFGPNEGPQPDSYGDPIANGIMDGCGGHTAFEYHHHELKQKCFMDSGLVATPWTNADVDSSVPSPVLGFAADGFPIYGPYGCVDEACTEVIEFKSAWEVKPGADPKTYAWDPLDNSGAANAYPPNEDGAYHYVGKESPEYLDKCNGRFGPDGKYRYHATADFPYLLGCYMGTPVGTGGGGTRGGGNQPPGPGNNGGPPSCETEADCTDACPPGSIGCTCHTTHQGAQICIPTCTSDADCPAGMNENQLICNGNGICVPPGGGPGGPPG
jgi:hypothetical protein